MTARSRVRSGACVALAWLALVPGAARADEQNDLAATCVLVNEVAWLINQVATLSLPTPFDYPNSVGAWATNLNLKFCPAVLEAPPDVSAFPTLDDGCTASFGQSHLGGTYINAEGFSTLTGPSFADLAGLPIPPGFPLGFLLEDELPYFPPGTPGLPGGFPDWGEIGTPGVAHFNSAVRITTHSAGTLSGGLARFPVGRNSLRWKADTLISPVDYVTIPIPDIEVKKKDKTLKKVVANTLKALSIAQKIVVKGKESGPDEVQALLADAPHGVTNTQFQSVVVWDDVPPTIESDIDTLVVEATDPGGEDSKRHVPTLRNSITVADKCGRPVLLNHTGVPSRWPLGLSEVEWKASDPGPNSATGLRNDVFLTHTVEVQDTLPPILIAPPSLVIQSDRGLDLSEIDLGNPAVFDLADLEPDVENDAPSSFPLDRRTKVVWSATDDGFPAPNRTEKIQWITVKSGGSNRAPTAESRSVDAISFEPIEIELRASDPDVLPDGEGNDIPDPLTFRIVDAPENGFFISPLQPYFVTDFRVERIQDLDEIERRCDRNDPLYDGEHPEADWVRDPVYVDVADDGTMYVIDRAFLRCDFPNADLGFQNRLAKFGPDGALLAQVELGSNPPRTFNWSPTGILEYTTTDSQGPEFHVRYDADLERITPSLRLDGSVAPNPPFNDPVRSVTDANDVLYSTNGREVYAFDTLDVDSSGSPAFLGPVTTGGLISVTSGVLDLNLDADGNLYISDPTQHRIYKWGPSQVDRSGPTVGFVPGPFLGWLGRCDPGSDPDACDLEDGANRSFGFSCTDATCVQENFGRGSGPGQLDEPRGLAIDPRGNLYVTEFQGRRVQRFTPEGFFAGEAKTECENRCFVLGDFGLPSDVSVNSTNFYVVDSDKDLVHIFETSPLWDVDNDHATVLYSSDNRFTGSDEFSFRANDTLVDSNLGRITVNVTRNFRAPEAEDSEVETDEDVPVQVVLDIEDPDGDALTVELLEPPANGTLSGLASGAPTYVPEPEFHGSDQFRFQVDDGMLRSRVATVAIQVNSVNDAPMVDVEAGRVGGPVVAGLGYEVTLDADVTDPDTDDLHLAVVDWGDGSQGGDDVILIDDKGTPSSDDDEARLPDVLMNKQGGETGRVAMTHIYRSTGRKTVELCVSDRVELVLGVKMPTDESETDCETEPVDVEPMVDVALGAEVAPDRVEEGTPADLTLALTVRNNAPVPGVTAQSAPQTVLTAQLPPGVDYLSAEGATCQVAASVITCPLGTLAPDTSRAVTLRARYTGDVVADGLLQLEASAEASPDDFVSNENAAVNVEVVLPAAIDPDGDGVRNADDNCPNAANEGQVDTDADGRGNACDADDDGDGMSDAFESRFGLDGLDPSDAGLDPDGDGFTNREEADADTDPGDPDSNPLTEGVRTAGSLGGSEKWKIEKAGKGKVKPDVEIVWAGDRWQADFTIDGERWKLGGALRKSKKGGRKLTFGLDEASRALLLERISALAEVEKGKPIEVRERKQPTLKVVLDKETRSKAKVTLKLKLLGGVEGKKLRDALYRLKLDGSVGVIEP